MKLKTSVAAIEPRAFVPAPTWQVAPLAVVREAMHRAIDGEAVTADEAREAIVARYAREGVRLSPAAVCLGIGGMSLTGVMATGQVVAISHPGDMQVLRRHVGDGRSDVWHRGFYRGVEYLEAHEEIDFKAILPLHEPQVAHVASPSPATGVAWTEKEWMRWVRYARQTGMTICHDASLAAYVSDVPATALGIPEATGCVLESVDMAAVGLQGVQYTIISDDYGADRDADEHVPAAAWLREYFGEQSLSPILLAGIVAWHSVAGQAEWRAYREDLAITMQAVREALTADGILFWGGVEAPVYWLATTDDHVLQRYRDAGLTVVPGSVYGPDGAAYTQLRIEQRTTLFMKGKEPI